MTSPGAIRTFMTAQSANDIPSKIDRLVKCDQEEHVHIGYSSPQGSVDFERYTPEDRQDPEIQCTLVELQGQERCAGGSRLRILSYIFLI